MKKLAIYYGYPSCVNRQYNSPDRQIDAFLGFDITVLGGGLENPAHPDHSKSKDIIGALISSGIEVFGYINIGITANKGIWPSYEELRYALLRWSRMDVNGILLDNIEPEYGTLEERLVKAAAMLRSFGLSAIYNTDFDNFSLPIFSSSSIQQGDYILIEPFGLGKGLPFPVPEALPSPFQKLKEKGIGLLGISTYDKSIDEGKDVLTQMFLRYKALAEKTGLDGWGFTEWLYSAEDALLPNFFGIQNQKKGQ